ncbi:hypothetical protein PG995_014922 [Apiospora arundinis]
MVNNNTSAGHPNNDDELQTQPCDTKTVPMGSFYILEKALRDDLWDSMNMKMPKFEGCESWVVPFPATLDFMQLVLFGFDDTASYIDDRYVRIVLRTVYDRQNSQEPAKELLLTPSNLSHDLQDARLQNAMVDAWRKLIRWMTRVVREEAVSLLSYLKEDMEKEVKAKLSSSSMMEEVKLSDMVAMIDDYF